MLFMLWYGMYIISSQLPINKKNYHMDMVYNNFYFHFCSLLPWSVTAAVLRCCTSSCVAKYQGPMEVLFNMSLKES